MKKKYKLFFVLLLFLIVPIIVIELQNNTVERKDAGTEDANMLPIVTEFPRLDAISGQTYKTSIGATDKDGDTLEYSFVCQELVSGCTDKLVKFPEGMKVDRNSGELTWKVPLETEDSVSVRIYISDQKDVIYYDYSIQIEKGDYYVREFVTIPSSGKISPGDELGFRLVLEVFTEIESISAVFLFDNNEVDRITWTGFEEMDLILLDMNSIPSFSYVPEEEGLFSVDLEVVVKSDDTTIINDLLNMIVSKTYAGNSITFNSSNNSSPVFDSNTDPYDNNIVQVGDLYSFDLKAFDPDGDNLSFNVLTPDPEHDWKEWLTITPIVSADGSEITFQCRGVPQKYGSYMVAITINDGIKNHFVTKIWPIVVQDDTENDIPVVNIKSPKEKVRVYPNGHVTFEWNVYDRNQIVKQIFYYSKDPSVKSSWVKINEFDHHVNRYKWASNLEPGTYFIIIEAYDNMEPEGVGFSVTEQIVILPMPDSNGGDDDLSNGGKDPDPGGEIITGEPFISNISPRDGAKITKLPVTVSATITAGVMTEVEKEDLLISVNGDDVTEKCVINQKDSDSMSFSCVLDDLDEGQQEVVVEVKNSADKGARKKWSFTYDSSSKEIADIDKDKEDDSSLFDGIISLWTGLTSGLRILIGVGLCLVILGFLLLVPLLFSGRKKESYTYNYQEDSIGGTGSYQSDQPTEPISPTGIENWDQNQTYNNPVVTMGDPTLSQVNTEVRPVEQSVYNTPSDTNDIVTSQPEDSTTADSRTGIINKDTSPVEDNNSSSLIFSTQSTDTSDNSQNPTVSQIDGQQVSQNSLTTPPPVNTDNVDNDDAYVPPPSLSL